jgi:hypothetical protein
MPPHLTVVGSVNLDLVARTDRLPRPGETVTGATFSQVPGGKGANQALAAARLGATVSLVACVGDDDHARAALAELFDWEPVLCRAGVHVRPERVAQAYLELAMLVRALEGLTAAATIDAPPDRGSLWAGLFDLRENLLGRALEDVRALAA